MGVKQEILNYCVSIGIDSVGFIKCRRFDELKEFYEKRKSLNLENEFEESNIELRINSKEWFYEGKTIISIAFPYAFMEKNKGVKSQEESGFSIYTHGLDYHYVLNKYLSKICEIIESYGGKSKTFVDSNTLPERYLAYISGVGFIGKNNLIITPKHGSYVFLGEIITDLEIYDDDKRKFEEINLFKECGNCRICYDKCPTKSINSVKKNCNICLSYITQKKELENWEMKKLGGRIFGCDTCQFSCPYNIHIEGSKLEEFRPLNFIDLYDEDYIINMNNIQFKESFKKTSCGWRGKNTLKRNAIIKKYIFKNEDYELIKNKKFDSPYLQTYVERIADIKSTKGIEKY